MQRLDTNQSVSPPFALLLLAVITLGLYGSSLIEITIKPSSVGIDDQSLLQQLFDQKITLHDAFLRSGSGKYYRPFLVLSYLADKLLWGDLIFGYRLTNVLLHTCNVMLVYLLGAKILRATRYARASALGSAVLFAVHPIAVESVSWISGRTDLLAAAFSLAAFSLFLSDGRKKMLCAIPLGLAAALSKETGIVVFILFLGWETYFGRSFDSPRKNMTAFLFVLTAGCMAYLVGRHNALAAQDLSAELVWSRFRSPNLLHNLTLFVSSFGFYAKKFIIPYPLQFAIDTINVPWYAVLGSVLVVLFCAGFFYPAFARLHFYQFWAMLGVLPAAVVSITDIAWTPWAERYLYLSLAPLSILIADMFQALLVNVRDRYRYFLYGLAGMSIVIFAVSTVQRSHLWNDTTAFARDTCLKSPDFLPASVEYASVLSSNGLRDEAERQLHKAEMLVGPKHLLFFNLGTISLGKGDYAEARRYYLLALDEARIDKKLVLMGPSLRKNILTRLANLEMLESGRITDRSRKAEHQRKAVGHLIGAYDEDPSDYFLLYNIGKMYLSVGMNAEAARYFEEFILRWKNNDIYRQTAEGLLMKIRTHAVPAVPT